MIHPVFSLNQCFHPLIKVAGEISPPEGLALDNIE